MAITEAHLNSPMVWGQSDCILTAADAVEAVLGDDPAKDIRGKYKSKTAAYRLIKQRGFKSVAEALSSLFEEIPVALAQRGDLGVYENTAGYFCEYGFAVKGEDGLRFLPRTMAEKAFKVS
ncbi:hypothetical protein F9L00_03440 [Brucella anthropi]|uniref:DUF6950 family protein n=1 Tax=Brucella/Ochrobactrum group TaxID=2826938 RepID=UPI00124CADB3|nr:MULTISPECIES: hypothetical protein [Brucella/Ochrobactrum group]KAB2782534.1 hypothetical protein F9L00_03440 [Brucella anthropi]MCQ9143340.1 hypothetical protein [Ochrobactrum sp. BTU2]UGQ23874.1 hypothetical protein LRL11_16590 [Brucella anthropi]